MPISRCSGRIKYTKCVLTQLSCLFLLNEPNWGFPAKESQGRAVRWPAVPHSRKEYLHNGPSEYLSTCQQWCQHDISRPESCSSSCVQTNLQSHRRRLRKEFLAGSTFHGSAAGWGLQEGIHFRQLCESTEFVPSISILHSWLTDKLSVSLLRAERHLFNDSGMTTANSLDDFCLVSLNWNISSYIGNSSP